MKIAQLYVRNCIFGEKCTLYILKGDVTRIKSMFYQDGNCDEVYEYPDRMFSLELIVLLFGLAVRIP